MTDFKKEPVASENSRRSLLAVVMLGVLLICVAVAWYLVQVRTVYPQETASAIIAQIRADGLGSYWHDKPQRLFYVHIGQQDSKRVTGGWMATGRDRTGDGYKGWRVERPGAWEVWSINQAANSADYTGPTTGKDNNATRIILADGHVNVEWTTLGGTVIQKTAPVPAPANYIPEGMLSLVVRLVAERGRDAAFQTIINDESIVEGKVNFALVKMSPKGRMVEVTTTLNKGTITAQYFLDDSGQIATIREKVGDVSADYRLTTGESLLRQFPHDPILAGLVRQALTEPAETEPSNDSEKVEARITWPARSPERT